MLNPTLKTIKIEWLLVKLNFQTLLEYRLNAFLTFIGSGLYNIGAVLFITFLFDRIPMLSGWDKWDLILLHGLGEIFAYFYFFITYHNAKRFSDTIRTGYLDFFLTKPVNSLIYSTLNRFAPDSLISLFHAFAIIFYALSNKSYQIDHNGILIASFSMIITLVIVHMINVITLIPSLWIVQSDFYRFFPETSSLMSYPYEIFDSKWLRIFFFTIIPYGLLINVPFRAIIGKLDYRLLLLQMLVCGAFVVVTSALWKWGLRHYSSASS